MSDRQKPRKLRRFFTGQTLQNTPHDLWLDPAESHHLRDSIRLKPGDACLVTDGQGGEAEAVVGEFAADGRTCLHVRQVLIKTGSFNDALELRVFPVMLRKGKTDLLVEKAQELGVHEFHAITSEHGEVQVSAEKTGKMVEPDRARGQQAIRESEAPQDRNPAKFQRSHSKSFGRRSYRDLSSRCGFHSLSPVARRSSRAPGQGQEFKSVHRSRGRVFGGGDPLGSVASP